MKSLNLKILETYLEYEGPLIYLGEDEISKKKFLVYFKNREKSKEKISDIYFITEITNMKELDKLVKNKIDIRSWYKNKLLFNYTISYENYKMPSESIKATNYNKLLAEGAIPKSGVFLID